ncbi:MAG TPA: hypothetical protein VGO80_19925 [Solirubrobacteraceae bacterium]|jgi:hypothetical protein|nr:hypothetical protein [Solirubrobacteraceae bacterium]
MVDLELFISDLPESLSGGATERGSSATLATAAAGDGPTTLAEKERDVTTLAVGEEGDDPGPTTLAVGEEGDDPGPTTLAVGEEGDDNDDPTTLAIGEEGDDPTTLAVGEEGDDE